MADHIEIIREEYRTGRLDISGETIRVLLDEIDRLQQRNNRVRSDFVLGEPPVCEHCCTTGKAIAHNTGDGWVWGWECECQRLLDDTMGDIDWPFVNDVANGEDWKLAGFELV